MKLTALKTFSAGGGKLTTQGSIFEASEERAKEYIRLGLAEEYDTQAPKDISELRGEGEGTIDPSIDIPRTEYTETELLEMNMTELKKIAKNIGVTGYSTMAKSEIIFAIRAKQKANQEELEDRG